MCIRDRTTEQVWRGLTGGRSVHLTDWPDADQLPADTALVTAMDRVRQVASTALALRKANKLRVRLPLAKLVIAADEVDSLAPFTEIIGDEVNVKEVVLTTDVAAHGHFQLAVNARAAGPRLGPAVQKVIKAVKAGEWTPGDNNTVLAAGVELFPEEYERRLVATDPAATAALPGNTGLVVLDTEVTPDLAAEGLARDLVRVVQQARRAADLDVSDRITLTLDLPAEVAEAVRPHETFIAGETLADEVGYASVAVGDGAPGFAGTVGDGAKVAVAVARQENAVR